MRKKDTVANARRRERDKKARDELADWYVCQLIVSSWGPMADETYREEFIKAKRAIVQLKRACREAIKENR